MSVDNVDILGFRWILSEGNLVAPRYTPIHGAIGGKQCGTAL